VASFMLRLPPAKLLLIPGEHEQGGLLDHLDMKLRKSCQYLRFQVLMAASMKFRFVFWDVLPCKIIVN
jgi:hypothetical protein